MLDTLINPVLSDNFGFTIADTSYFFLGIMVLLVGGTGVQYVLIIELKLTIISSYKK